MRFSDSSAEAVYDYLGHATTAIRDSAMAECVRFVFASGSISYLYREQVDILRRDDFKYQPATPPAEERRCDC